MRSYQNLVLLQNLYRLKSIGFEYIDHFSINNKNNYTKVDNFAHLVQNIKSCHLCDLSKSRKQSMVGFGNNKAELFVLDYSVSSVQDASNSYYTSRAGVMLKNMLERVVGVLVEDVYMTHCVKCKPLDINKPSPSEIESCKSYLYAQLEMIKPKVVVTLGGDAYKTLTLDESNFENIRGHVIEFRGFKIIPIYHPQYLLRNPELKKITQNDLKIIKRVINEKTIYSSSPNNTVC